MTCNTENDLATITTWAATAPRGERARASRELGLAPQVVSQAIRQAAAGQRTKPVQQLLAWLTAHTSAADAVARLVQPAPRACRLDRLVRAVVAASGASAASVAEELRRHYPTLRNIIDEHEYVLAMLAPTTTTTEASSNGSVSESARRGRKRSK